MHFICSYECQCHHSSFNICNELCRFFQLQKNNIATQLSVADVEIKTNLDKLSEIPYQLDAASKTYAQQLALYKSGLNTLIEVTNAQYVLLQAESNYVITQDELLQLLYIRAGLAGQSDIFLQNFKR